MTVHLVQLHLIAQRGYGGSVQDEALGIMCVFVIVAIFLFGFWLHRAFEHGRGPIIIRNSRRPVA